MMRLFCLPFVLLLLLNSSSAIAEQELIGTTQIVTGQMLDAHYPNLVFDPGRKVLSFTGEARVVNAPLTQAAILGIHFDYLDQNGIEQIVPLPNFYQEAIPADGTLVTINAGPVILPYCPDLVSIHFELIQPEDAIVEFQGIFDHTCIPIPEPTTLSLALLGGIVAVRRRRVG